MRGVAAIAAAVAVAAFAAAPSQAIQAPTWIPRIGAAEPYAEARAGIVAFALIDERGELHGRRAWAVAPAASVLKPMLLVAYLRKKSVRHRALTEHERGLLGPMIRRSDNAAAEIILASDGRDAIMRLARLAGMKRFELHLPSWGDSEITPRDQARFFYRIDSYIPARHRRYAMRLLAAIVPSQRWGLAQIATPGRTLHFKGGWKLGTGLVDHQVGVWIAGDRRVSLAVTTRFNPSHSYGKETLRGVAARLLRGLPRPVATPLPPSY